MEKYLTPEEISEALKVPETTVTRWFRKKVLIGFKVGGLWRISEKNFNDFIKIKENETA